MVRSGAHAGPPAALSIAARALVSTRARWQDLCQREPSPCLFATSAVAPSASTCTPDSPTRRRRPSANLDAAPYRRPYESLCPHLIGPRRYDTDRSLARSCPSHLVKAIFQISTSPFSRGSLPSYIRVPFVRPVRREGPWADCGHEGAITLGECNHHPGSLGCDRRRGGGARRKPGQRARKLRKRMHVHAGTCIRPCIGIAGIDTSTHVSRRSPMPATWRGPAASG